MSDEKKYGLFGRFVPSCNGFPLPPFPFATVSDGKEKSETEPKFDKKKVDEKIDDIDSTMLTVWDQLIDLQKSSMDSSRDMTLQFYEHMMKIQDTFADSLPEEFPVPAGFMQIPVSPKGFMDQVKKFQKMSKDHITEQADSVADFLIKSQTQMRDAASKTTEKASKQRKERGAESKSKTAASAKRRAPAKRRATAKRRAPAKKGGASDAAADPGSSAAETF